MELVIENVSCAFVPIKDFRAQRHLAADFGVALFEPKDYSGLGRVDSAGAKLNAIRPYITCALPAEMPLNEWIAFLPHLTASFRSRLYDINAEVGLKDVEIDYAVAGFSDVCTALVYSMLRARAAGEPAPTFRQVYAAWLNSTVKISNTVHSYVHEGETWQVQIINQAYGRVGLMITMRQGTYYVQDGALGCPAEGFMLLLLSEVAERMIAVTR